MLGCPRERQAAVISIQMSPTTNLQATDMDDWASRSAHCMAIENMVANAASARLECHTQIAKMTRVALELALLVTMRLSKSSQIIANQCAVIAQQQRRGFQ